MSLLEQINSPADLKKLDSNGLAEYAAEVRRYIIETVTRQGGHLASNLGAVEFTVALHYVFDCPQDKIIWDVGHQSYTHKIITGRREAFSRLRSAGGVSGFPCPEESPYDCMTAGHSTTSLSVALGLARAQKLSGEKGNIISVIGDGALTGGMAYEALNDIGSNKVPVIIVLNDNKMSISKNVGALSDYLARLRLSKNYSAIKSGIKKSLSTLPYFGEVITKALKRTRRNIKGFVLINKMFEDLGLKYYGPFDGHDINSLIEIFEKVKDEKRPVILHLVTKKGKGYAPSELDPAFYHGVSKKEEIKAEKYSFGTVAGEKLCEMADERNIAVITAAMTGGSGLSGFAEKHKERFFDVGIAEEHAVTMSAGLAKGGVRPFFAVYSTFLQRGFDQLLHDICIEGAAVTFLIDRAGAVDGDGRTHQGIFDLSYLGLMPGMTVIQPKDGGELRAAMELSVKIPGPVAIRYPKFFIKNYPSQGGMADLSWETLKKGKTVCLLAAGNRMLDICFNADTQAEIVNARVIKPLDTNYLDGAAKKFSLIITLEDGVLKGGFGESVLSYFNAKGYKTKIVNMGYPDIFLKGYTLDELLDEGGLNTEGLIKNIELGLKNP